MIKKCFRCNKYFKKEDIFPAGFSTFACSNCYNEFLKRKAEPLNIKWWKFWKFFLILFFIPIVIGDNITLQNTTLYSPSNFTFIYDTFNKTYFKDFYCYDNITQINYSSERCDITRTLENGETFARDDSYCKLNFQCEKYDCEEIQNQTYNVHWRIYRINDSIYLYNEVKNETRIYPASEQFDYEIQLPLSCPTLDSWNDELQNRIDNFRPINLTNDQWSYYCLEPFGRYGDTLKEVTTINLDYQLKTNEQIADCIGTRDALSRENGELRQKASDYDSLNNEYNVLKQDYQQLNNQLVQCEKDKAGQGTFNVFFWIVLGINIIIGLLFFMKWSYDKYAGLGDKK